MNKLILHLEGFTVLGLSIYFYSVHEFSWILFIVLLFAPDLSMIGYVKNNQFGAVLYNIFHTYIIPLALLLIGILIDSHVLLMISLIWIAHIGMDRMVGYGLKYPTDFKDTHLNKV